MALEETYDLLMTFPKKTTKDTFMWILKRIQNRAPDLSVDTSSPQESGVYTLYFSTKYDQLLKGAEELCIRKAVKADSGGGYAEFVFEDQECFEGIEDEYSFFSNQERQNIVRHMLYNVRAIDRDILGNIKFLEKETIIPKLLSKGVIKDIIPLHKCKELESLYNSWVQGFFRSQPLDKIEDYFGVKIAMYFAYLGHYTKALIFPSVVGIWLWFSSGKDEASDDLYTVIFALVNIYWASFYLESWKRSASGYAYKWGVDVADDLIVEPRPFYHGPIIKSKVTGRLEPCYPLWKRNLFRIFISSPVMTFCFVVAFFVLTNILEIKIWVNMQVDNGDLHFLCKVFPNILMVLAIALLNLFGAKIAYWLNDKENHRLEETYQNKLITKLFLLKFVNSFLSLFYAGFYLQDMDLLKQNLAGVFITKQIISHIKEAVIPYIVVRLKGFFLTRPSSTKNQQTSKVQTSSNKRTNTIASQNASSSTGPKSLKDTVSDTVVMEAIAETNKIKYQNTIADHLEMCIQFGYVTLFSCVFPLAALCALINNYFEIHTDAFKLCTSMQRPFGERRASIGNWQYALEFMSVLAVIVNCVLIGMSNFMERMFPNLTASERIVLVIAFEHATLLLKFVVAYAIPDLPKDIAEEKARLEFLRREALKKNKRLIKYHKQPSTLQKLNKWK